MTFTRSADASNSPAKAVLVPDRSRRLVVAAVVADLSAGDMGQRIIYVPKTAMFRGSDFVEDRRIDAEG
jgi:hypothetical protein